MRNVLVSFFKYLPVFIVLIISKAAVSQIAIGPNPPDSSAMLDVQSTARGFLPPRLSPGQILAIHNPKAGLIVYNAFYNKPVFFNGTEWKFFCNEIKDSILVRKIWNVDFVYSYIGNDLTKYVRGEINTTGLNFDNQTYKFNADGTGIYKNVYGSVYNFTWQFTTADKRTMSFNIPSLNSYSTWEMVEITDGYYQFTVVAAAPVNNLSTYRLIQLP